MAPSEARKFFKVILNSTLQEGKMKIPKKFVKEHGSDFSETVRLAIPTYQSWSVRIERDSDNTVFLHDGLDKFLENNSIGFGFILVFKYEGNSRFGVQIFDLTASEIQYTCIDDSVHSDDSSVEYLGSSQEHILHGNRKVRRCYFTRRRKQVMEGGMHGLTEANGSNEDNVKTNHNGKRSTIYKDTIRNDGTNASPSDFEKERIIEPENESSPNFFRVTMTSSYIKKYFVTVPCSFAQLPMSGSRMLIKLVDDEDNEWAVRYIEQPHHNVLGSGWGNFVQDKKLMVGDVCTFQRVWGGDEIKLRVTISRTDGKKSTVYKDNITNDGVDASSGDLGKERIIEPENKTSPTFFEVTLTPSYIEKGLLGVPTTFARLHMAQSTMLIKLVDGEDNEWEVRYIRQRYSNLLSLGWRHFVRDKKLRVGDLCMFERVFGGDEVKLRVTISRSGKQQNL